MNKFLFLIFKKNLKNFIFTILCALLSQELLFAFVQPSQSIKSAQPNQQTIQEDKNIALLNAIVNNDIEKIKTLLNPQTNVNTNVNYKNYDGKTPLMFALQYIKDPKAMEDIITLLLKSGAYVNDKDNVQRTTLMYTLRYIKDPQAIINIVNLLLNAGININDKDKVDKTALMYALIYIQDHKSIVDIVTLLIQNGARVNDISITKQTPLLLALTEIKDPNAMIDIIKLLVKNGANINQRYCFNQTPLVYALKWIKDLEALKDIIPLLILDTSISDKDEYGKTPLSIARARIKNPATLEFIEKILIAHGATD